jgi:hypothetical protein
MGSFADDFQSGYNALLDVNYRLLPNLALMGFFGYNGFKSRTTSIDDTYWMNLSFNLRYYWSIPLTIGPRFSVYIGGGPGIYIPEIGDTEFGLNAGFGINYELSAPITLELGTDYHWIFDPDIQFMHGHAGFVFRF